MTPVLNAFESVAPDQTVAMAAQIHDERLNKKQQAINQDFENELNSIQLTTDELDAIINEVDLDGIRIIATPQTEQSGDDFAVYRFADGDTEDKSYDKYNICFSKPDGEKYYLYVEERYSPTNLENDPERWSELKNQHLYTEVGGKVEKDSGYQVKKVENIPSNS